MKFAVIGGDRRSALLAELLQMEGHRVRCCALEKAGLPEELPCSAHLQGALYGADAAILPMPVEKGSLLNAPLSTQSFSLEELSDALWPGQMVFGGLFSENFLRRAALGSFYPTDLMRRPAFVTGNAALTAECALGLLLQESEKSLCGSRVLILGFGRIGRFLAQKLRALGAAVTVAARRPESRVEAEAAGCGSATFDGIGGGYDYVVNTVPDRILGEEALCCLPEDALLLELASAPGGFDRTLAENLGLRVIAAPGLPGRSAPLAAARLMWEEIKAVMREERDA